MKVGEIMQKDVVTATPNMSLAHKFGCLPIVRGDNTLVGIITVTDLLRAYVQQHEATHPAG